LGVVKIPSGVITVLVGNSTATTVSIAVVRAGSACASFALVAGETVALAGSAIACAFVGTLTVKVCLIVWGNTSCTSVTIVVGVQLGLAATYKVDTENLGVETRIEVTCRSMFAITIKITNGRVNESGTVSANSFTAVGSKPVAVAVTLRSFTTSAVPGTVVWASCTCETENRKESDHLHYV
jgi:hypothetical protein